MCSGHFISLPLTIILTFLLFTQKLFAGYTELGLSGSYRQTSIDEQNYSITQSGTGSIAYYFLEYSALEASYTNGRTTSVTINYNATADFELTGLDFILSFGSATASFRPYIKVGGAYQKKQITYKQKGFDPVIVKSEGPSPSAGIGFRLALTQTFALKAGAEAWTSPITKDSSEKTTYDYAGRMGVSWVF